MYARVTTVQLDPARLGELPAKLKEMSPAARALPGVIDVYAAWRGDGQGVVIADGEPKTIQSDWLNYFSMYGGLGVSLVQTAHFSTGVQLTGGFRAYDETTFEGFHNTLFPETGYTQLTVEAVYRF